MASSLSGNWACINSEDHIEEAQFSQINTALWVSLMEETQSEDQFNDERLTSLIRSLEAEINPHKTDTHVRDSVCSLESYPSCNSTEQAYGQDCWPSLDMDLCWDDMEMGSDTSASDDDIRSWYPSADEMEGGVDFGRAYRDCLQGNVESYLWPEACDVAM